MIILDQHLNEILPDPKLFLWLYSRMRDLGQQDALTVKQLDAGLKCPWNWAWLKLDFQVKGDMQPFPLSDVF